MVVGLLHIVLLLVTHLEAAVQQDGPLRPRPEQTAPPLQPGAQPESLTQQVRSELSVPARSSSPLFRSIIA